MGISDSLAHLLVVQVSLGDPMFMRCPCHARHPILLRTAMLMHIVVSSKHVSGFTIFGRLTTVKLRNEA